MTKMTASLRALRWAALCLTISACGGDADSHDACVPFTSCGGDPVGLWHGRGFCPGSDFSARVAALIGLPSECAQAVSIAIQFSASDLELTAEGSYRRQETIEADWTMHFDTTCLGAMAGQPLSAVQLPAACDSFAQSLTAADSPFLTLSCTVANAACDCTGVQQGETESAGTFEVRGSELSLDDGSVGDFCVRGDTLSIQSGDDTLGPAILVYQRD